MLIYTWYMRVQKIIMFLSGKVLMAFERPGQCVQQFSLHRVYISHFSMVDGFSEFYS